MGPIGEDLENDERTQHRIGVDLVDAIQKAENRGDAKLVDLLLQLAESRLISKGYKLADESKTPGLTVIK